MSKRGRWVFLGIVLGIVLAAAAVQGQHVLSGGATTGGALTVSASPPFLEIRKSLFLMVGKDGKDVLRITPDGEVWYQGRLLGTDSEVWWGLRAVFNPGSVCQEWERLAAPLP